MNRRPGFPRYSALRCGWWRATRCGGWRSPAAGAAPSTTRRTRCTCWPASPWPGCSRVGRPRCRGRCGRRCLPPRASTSRHVRWRSGAIRGSGAACSGRSAAARFWCTCSPRGWLPRRCAVRRPGSTRWLAARAASSTRPSVFGARPALGRLAGVLGRVRTRPCRVDAVGQAGPGDRRPERRGAGPARTALGVGLPRPAGAGSRLCDLEQAGLRRCRAGGARPGAGGCIRSLRRLAPRRRYVWYSRFRGRMTVL